MREAGISKSDNLIDMRQLEACIRSELDLTAQRRIAVLDPVKLVVDNYPADKTEYFDIANNPNREANDATTRKVAFTKELWIEKEDFAEVPPPKFKRLTVGGEVRLMGGYLVKCESVEKDPDGSIAVIHCTADLETGNGNPADKTEYFDVANNPNREANDTTTRKVAFTRELWIDAEDFAEVPPPKFKRLTVDGEVRLMGAYIVKCTGVDKNADGSIAAIHCTADLETGNGNPADGRKVKGTIHWVSAAHAVDAEVRLYDKLFTEANMNAIPEGSDYKDYLNPESVVVRKDCKLEEALADAKPGEQFQFVRTGFFTPDSKNPGVYNRVVTLRDSFKPAK